MRLSHVVVFGEMLLKAVKVINN